MNKLNPQEIDQALTKLGKDWFISGDNYLSRSFQTADFGAARKLVNCLAEAADKLDHHPDINWSYNEVEVRITTHEAGGLTDKDFDFARRASQCLPKN